MSITNILLTIWDRLCATWRRVWVLIVDNHIFAMIGVAWVALKTGAHIVAMVFSAFRNALIASQQAMTTATGMASAPGAMRFLSLANSFFPLYEALYLAAVLLYIKMLFIGINAIRYAYKQIPYKAT